MRRSDLRNPDALGCDVAAITHSHPAGFLSAGFLALLIDRIVQGDALDDAVAEATGRLAEEPAHDETLAAVEQAVSLARSTNPSPETVERLGGGWIGEEALAIAVFSALVHPTDLEAAVTWPLTTPATPTALPP